MQFQRDRVIQETIVRCDRCGRDMVDRGNDCEWQERMVIHFRAGYGSIFGDGNLVDGDFCQHCVNATLGKYLGSRIQRWKAR